jgi:hypothetical protein
MGEAIVARKKGVRRAQWVHAGCAQAMEEDIVVKNAIAISL